MISCPKCNVESSFTKKKNVFSGSKMICDECGHEMKYYDYNQIANPTTLVSIDSDEDSNSQNVTVTDIKMPFFSMVEFMVKWAFASIPAFIILFLIGFLMVAIFGIGAVSLFK